MPMPDDRPAQCIWAEVDGYNPVTLDGRNFIGAIGVSALAT